MSVLDRDPSKPSHEILADICEAATSQTQPGLAMLPFATLLVKLSREASETADKNLRIQKNIIWLTVIILLISISQLLIAFKSFPAKPEASNAKIETMTNQQTPNSKKSEHAFVHTSSVKRKTNK
ncbi:MAG: hypothetical protein H7X83_10105 [Verrucomicrobia bacterium]|nr:hypothetical protein [Deltaproteobacteria bacterium]